MKFDEAYDYVKNYFQRNFLESYLISEGRMQYVESDYLNFFRDNIINQYDIVDITSGNVDSDLNKYLENFVSEYFTKKEREDILFLNNYVSEFLSKCGVNQCFSDDIFDHIVKKISSRVWSQFDRSRLGKEDFDHVINLVYNNILNEYSKSIAIKVDNILDKRANEYFDLRKLGLDKDKLKKYVVDVVFKNESRIFLIKVKSLIISIDRNLTDTGIELNKYVSEYFSKYLNKYGNSSSKNREYVRSNNFYNQDEDVEDKKNVQNNNSQIRLNLNNMKNNSVKNGFFPDKFRLNKKQIVVSKTVITLALLGTLLGVGINISSQEKYTDDEYAIMRVEMLTGFDYDKKIGRDNKFNNDMKDEVISLYFKLEQLPNESYKLLGLYNVYDGLCKVSGDEKALIEMEHFFGDLRKKIINEELMFGMNDSLKVFENNYFFLDLVYDTLIDMGYDELNNKKYQDVLLRYKYANFGNYYGVVGVYLTKDELILIDDIISKYVESYEKIKLDIGYLMVDGNYTFFDTYKSNSRKGI